MVKRDGTTLDKVLIREYDREIDKYRLGRDMAIELYERVGVARFSRDLSKFKAYLRDAQQTHHNLELVNALHIVAEKYGLDRGQMMGKLGIQSDDLAQVIEQHEIELRIGKPFRQLYADMVSGTLNELEGKAQTVSDAQNAGQISKKDYRRTCDHLRAAYVSRDASVKKKRGFFARLLNPEDIFFIPVHNRLREFSSRNNRGFYETKLKLPLKVSTDEREELAEVSMFTKFFGSEYDWKKSNATSNYLNALGLPYLKVFAKHGDKIGNHVSTTEWVAGEDSSKLMTADHETRMDVLKGIVTILAETHVRGATKESKALFEEHYPDKRMREDMQQDLETFFLHNYMLRRIFGKDELADLSIQNGQRPDKKKIMHAHQKLMKSSGEKYDQYRRLYRTFKTKVLDVLENERLSRIESGDIAFLMGDAHTGNFRINEQGEIKVLDPEMACLGFGEFDLYKLIEDGRNGLARSGRYEEAKFQLITHYVRTLEKLKGRPTTGEDFTRKVRNALDTYNVMRCLMDFTTHAMFKDYADFGKNLKGNERENYLKLSKKYYQRGRDYLTEG